MQGKSLPCSRSDTGGTATTRDTLTWCCMSIVHPVPIGSPPRSPRCWRAPPTTRSPPTSSRSRPGAWSAGSPSTCPPCSAHRPERADGICANVAVPHPPPAHHRRGRARLRDRPGARSVAARARRLAAAGDRRGVAGRAVAAARSRPISAVPTARPYKRSRRLSAVAHLRDAVRPLRAAPAGDAGRLAQRVRSSTRSASTAAPEDAAGSRSCGADCTRGSRSPDPAERREQACERLLAEPGACRAARADRAVRPDPAARRPAPDPARAGAPP